MKRVLDKTLLLYMLLGIFNYLFCSYIMLLVYNKIDAPQGTAFLTYYVLSTIISLVLNRYVTFRHRHPDGFWFIRFVLVVLGCYLVAQVGIKATLDAVFLLPRVQAWLVRMIHTHQIRKLENNITLLVSSFSYCILNYFGQRYYVFRDKKTGSASP